ncbi:MAG: restriction endonuclease [Acidobacteria bacterium]|nr:restriction endonuclease [Acidobacteriota bacterium]MBI3421986.1 restriction endonuclease [Acidobacteriota bacterium]
MDTLPHRNELMRPTVEAIRSLGGSGSVEEIVEKVISILGIPDELVTRPYITKRGNEDGRTQLEYELAWVRTYLKQLGVLENSARGVWARTGKEFIDETGVALTTPDKAAVSVDWRERINKCLVEILSPSAFERLVQRMLRETGFAQVEVTGRTGDGGIDGKGIAKINGILSFRVVFQCKRYRGSVSASEIRDFRGAMQGRADKGLFITTGYFTRDAVKEATRDGAIAIDIVDGEKLAEKLKELSLGVKIELVENIVVDEEWFKAI